MLREKRQIIIYDSPNDFLSKYKNALEKIYGITIVHDEQSLFSVMENNISLVLVDFRILQQGGENLFQQIKQSFPEAKIAIISDTQSEDYISFIREMKITNVLPKSELFDEMEIPLYTENIITPTSGFGLIRYLDHTIEMFIEEIKTKQDKTRIIEKVINHFATCGFDVHELYDVRLILEEMINNAFFHAFVDADKKEKYKISTFKTLEPKEKVYVEYGSDNRTVGFAVSDNGGVLTPERVIEKLERQYNKEGIYDESGRGLYLSRMLSNRLIINIQKNVRTQNIVLFREKSLTELKPVCINFSEE